MEYYRDNDIIIRSIKKSDVVPFFSYQLKSEVAKYDIIPIPHNTEELLKACEAYCHRFDNYIMNSDEEKNKYIYFVITDLDDHPIGYVNLFSIDSVNKHGELGMVLGSPRYWSKGIGYIAACRVIEYIFDHMNIDKIYIETLDFNYAARALCKKLGFEPCDAGYDCTDMFLCMVLTKEKNKNNKGCTK